MKDLKQKVIDLSNLDGISSNEEKVAEYIKNETKTLKNIKYERDNLGSLALINEVSKDYPTVSFTAHMDEVGFMVTNIKSDGFIEFSSIGGWWGHVVLGKLLKIITDDEKEIIGVVGSKPPHMLEPSEAKNVMKIKSMFLDIGAKTKDEVLKLGIKIGDQITPYQEKTIEVLNDRIIGKAHDDRVGVAVGMEVMQRLNSEKLSTNVIFVASTQEEVGLRGARTSAYKWTPDIAFAIDVTIASDVPGMESKDTKLGSGVALSIFDSSVIGNKKLIKYVEEVAKKHKINYTFDSLTGGGTDAGTIHLAKDGVITMTISIPSRYIHSHNSMIDLKDLESTVDLITNFVKGFNSKELEKIKFN